MADSSHTSDAAPMHTAYREGRRMGLAMGALALSLVAFVNLLGIEKSALAIVLALLALQGGWSGVGMIARRARIALAVSGVHVVTVIAVLILFHGKLLQLLSLLHKLS